MADGTKIEWADATWNPITGCSVVSPGCTNCYAMKLAGTRMKHHWSRAGLTDDTKGGPVWNGNVWFNEKWLDQPLHWKKPRRIFVCAHGDLFHENVPDEWIDRVFAVMFVAWRHTFILLTKRSDRQRAYLSDPTKHERWAEVIRKEFRGTSTPTAGWFENYGKRIWLGVSVEDQTRADERIPDLLDTPAAVRWISAEPLLGEVNFDRRVFDECSGGWLHHLDWIVAGGESGPNARPMHPDWARSIRDQCAAAGVAYFHKQNGEFASVSEVEGPGRHFTFPDGATVRRVGKKAAGALLDGKEHREWPA